MKKTLIERVELASNQSSVTFSSISSDFDDLMILLSVRSDDTSVSAGYDPLLYRFNSSTTGYSGRQLYGTGSSVGSGSEATRTSAEAGGTWGRLPNQGIDNDIMTSNTFSSVSMYVPNFASANYKSVSLDYVNENNGTTGYQEIVAHLWSNTSAISSISFALGLGSFVSGSSLTLFGITSGSDGTTTVS
jgi:hypothetical protein